MSDPDDALEALALELLEIPSVIGDERRIADHVEEFARTRGFDHVERQGDNVLLRPRPLRTGRARLLLLGHLDTVPPAGENVPHIEADRLHGLGASDMKCADALILLLLDRARTHEPAFDLCGVLYAGEEGPYEGSGFPEIAPALDGAFGRPDLALAMEPTDNHIELGCLGTMHAAVRFRGRRAHSARPWEGRNAIHMAAPLLAALGELAPRDVDYDGLSFREVVSATMIGYDGARNVIPGGCDVNVNFRFAPDRTGSEAVAWFTGFVRGTVGTDAVEAGDVTIEVRDLCPSGRVCHDNALYRSLVEALPAGTQVRAKQAWTDVGRLSEMGIDAINFGPGSGSQAHQAGEYCLRPNLEAAWRGLAGWLFPAAG